MDVKVGDWIYFTRYGNLSSRAKVERITPKGLVKTSRYTMRLEDNDPRVVQDSRWGATSAHIETPELEREWRTMVAKDWLRSSYDRIEVEDTEPLMKKYKEQK